MNRGESSAELSGKLLIAMPGMGDRRFEKAVVYICVHSPDGSMGLIVNKPSFELDFEALLKQLSIEQSAEIIPPQVHFGGPVELGRGFVLHSAEYGQGDGTMKVDQSFAMTATLDVLEDLAQGQGPKRALLALGYAALGPGQLESEIVQNGWLTCDASTGVVFEEANETKWEAALKSLGIDPLMLSSTAGHA
ncbi:MAG: YqgE/AlgH family protein [Halocynthiibacter sp.]